MHVKTGKFSANSSQTQRRIFEAPVSVKSGLKLFHIGIFRMTQDCLFLLKLHVLLYTVLKIVQSGENCAWYGVRICRIHHSVFPYRC